MKHEYENVIYDEGLNYYNGIMTCRLSSMKTYHVSTENTTKNPRRLSGVTYAAFEF
jgi:hypothetical protein